MLVGFVSGIGCANGEDPEAAYVRQMMCEDKCEDEANECYCGPNPDDSCDVEMGADSSAMACRVERDRNCLPKC